MGMKQRKPVEDLRVPLNCLIAPATKEAITSIQNDTRESQGEVIDRALGVLMGITPERVTPKLSRRDRAIKERAQTDGTAKRAERDDIDYSDVESTPTTHVSTLDATGQCFPVAEARRRSRIGERAVNHY
jgi:hypothetical protein